MFDTLSYFHSNNEDDCMIYIYPYIHKEHFMDINIDHHQNCIHMYPCIMHINSYHYPNNEVSCMKCIYLLVKKDEVLDKHILSYKDQIQMFKDSYHKHAKFHSKIMAMHIKYILH